MIVDLEKVKAFARDFHRHFSEAGVYEWEGWVERNAGKAVEHIDDLVANVDTLRKQSGDLFTQLQAARDSFYALRGEYEKLEKENKRLSEIEWMYKDLCR